MPQHITSERWNRVQSLFFAALDLPMGERAAFLQRECGDDTMLHDEVTSLLAASGEASFLDHPPLHADAPAAEAQAGILAPGARLGVWRIERMLGAGGMGEVYLAVRAEGGFAQQAAVKLLRSDMRGHDQRFLAERDILAQLDHPRIARLLDGGIDAGHAWMAMEYVDGQDLRDYCREQQPGLPQRLALFRQICVAVAHAHANLVIHRDLKPNNILITPDGFVKLLDFGVAKLDDGQIPHDSTATTPFTPDHAAPEQLQGLSATTAIDIFSLGVILYELLCGSTPWSRGDTPMARAIDKLMREDPKPPSQVIETLAAPPVPARLVRGDLDAIALRCLRREPGDRYPTVQALLDDVARFEANEPVLARKGSGVYRLRRWMRRHVLVVGATTSVALALVAGIGVSLWQAGIARREARHAQQSKQLLLSVFREQDPLSRANPQGRPPAKVIADGIRALDAKLVTDPVLRNELMDELGELQANVGDLPGGRATLIAALKARGALHGENSAEVAITERKLASVEQQIGNNNAAEQHARRAIAIWVRSGEAHSVEATRAKLIVSYVSQNRKNRDEAYTLAREAVDDLTRALGPNDPETVAAEFHQAQLLLPQGKYKEAEAKLRDVIARTEVVAGADSARLVTPLATLANLLRTTGQSAVAETAFIRVIALARHQFGDKHNSLATALARYGALKQSLGQNNEALALFDQAEAAMPDNGSAVLGIVLANRGMLYMKLGRYDSAERDFHRAFELGRKTVGDDDGDTWLTASFWGRALARQGKLREAERIQRDALSRISKILGPDAYTYTLALDALAETLLLAYRSNEAIQLLEQSLAATARQYPATDFVYQKRLQHLNQARQGKVVSWDAD